EVESLIDRDHETEVLEGEANDLVTGDLELLGKLCDGNELVDANRFPFLLDSGLALRLHFFARYSFVAARRSLARASAHGGHRLEDVGRYRFLFHATTATASTRAVILACRCTITRRTWTTLARRSTRNAGGSSRGCRTRIGRS